MQKIIKLCGITNIIDANVCLDFGANSLGFIFEPNTSRYLTIEQALFINNIDSREGYIRLVAVFQDASIEYIQAYLSQIPNINTIQLHGSENISQIEKIKELYPQISIIKAYRKPTRETIQNIKLLENIIDYLLIDGIGEISLEDSINLINNNISIILAGGLNIDNIQNNIVKYNQYLRGYDLCSGIEILDNPRQKDHQKIKEFMHIVKSNQIIK